MENAVIPPSQIRKIQGSKIDTVTLAKQVQEEHGSWEAEISFGGEKDLHKHLNGCVKNPGHQKFVPVDQFNVDHLPPGCRDNDLVDYVRALSDVTVRVSVKHVSERRPETVPGSDKPYPSYKDGGRNMMRTGTGSVWRVDKYPNERDSSTTCGCQECLDSPTPKTQFAKICVHTSAHVVYDKLEAAHTTCHLFFDKGGSPRDCSGVLELSGWGFVWRRGEVEEDWCLVVHVTHDLDLADRLDKMVALRVNLWEKVRDKFHGLKSGRRESSSPSKCLPEVWNNLTIIVSHPHGCSKQIGVGYCTGRDEREGPTWDPTLTCPGSSGAPVFTLGDRRVREKADKYRGLESGEQMSLSPSERLHESWEKVKIKDWGLKSGERESSSPSEHLPEVLDNLTIKVSRPDGGSNKQAQIHREPSTIVTNQAISHFATTHDLVANSQNMGKADEEKECFSNLLSVETEPRENQKKAESTYQINVDKLLESESFLSSLTDETATKSHEEKPDWIHRATKIIIVLNFILCLVMVILTVALVILGGGSKGEEQLPQETCVQCSKLLSNTTHSIEADPLLNKLTKRLDNGLQMCCAQDEGQMSAMLEVAARKRTSLQAPKPHEMVANPRFFPVSVKKQLLPAIDSKLNMTEVLLSYDPRHHALRFSTDYHDPLTEHVRGVKIWDSAIEINYTGLYYVYMNIFIHVKSPQPPRSLLFQNWFQYVHHTRPGDQDKDSFILQTTHTTLMENINDQETAFAGGTFYLKKGDLIEVCVNGLGLLDYQKESTFLGLFMLENGEMKQEMFF